MIIHVHDPCICLTCGTYAVAAAGKGFIRPRKVIEIWAPLILYYSHLYRETIRMPILLTSLFWRDMDLSFFCCRLLQAKSYHQDNISCFSFSYTVHTCTRISLPNITFESVIPSRYIYFFNLIFTQNSAEPEAMQEPVEVPAQESATAEVILISYILTRIVSRPFGTS